MLLPLFLSISLIPKIKLKTAMGQENVGSDQQIQTANS